MTDLGLDGADVVIGLQQMGGIGMAESMGSHPLGDIRLAHSQVERFLQLKRHTAKYGDDLVCIRFRYDAISKQRLKTVELVIERTDWEPPPEKFSDDTLVAVKVEGYETYLRKLIKDADGKWKPDRSFGMFDMAILRELNRP